jgi:hypothetical protein
MTREGGREGGRGEGVAGSSSAVLLREIDALAAEVDAAERQLQAKVLAATAAAAVTAAAEEQSREEENEQEEDAAATMAYLQQELSALKGQEGMLAAQQRAAEGRVRALKERLGRLASSSSSSSSSTGAGKTADSLQQRQKKKSDTASTGDVLIAARQFKTSCRKHAQEVATLAAARRQVAGRVREVEGQMQEVMATAQREAQARARRLREKRVEKAALKTRLAQLRHAVGSDGGGGGGGGGGGCRKGGGRGGGRRERREDDEEHDQELSRVLGLDDDEDGDENVRGKKEKEEGSWMGRGRVEVCLKASTASKSASSPIKKRSKTLFVPSPPRGPQPPLGRQSPSSPFRRRSSVTAVGGLVFTGKGGGEEGWQVAEGEEEEDGIFDQLTESIDALQARILDKLNNNV